MDFNRYPFEYDYDVNRAYGGNPYYWNPYESAYPSGTNLNERQQMMQGQATWTEGGQYTKCGIPWSENEYMTASVGENTPYACGEVIKVINPQTGREIRVTVVDEVRGYPANRINLHRHAFEALGANLNVGILNVYLERTSNEETGRFMERTKQVVQAAHPGAVITGQEAIDTTITAVGNIRESYRFRVEMNGVVRTIRAEVVYEPATERIITVTIRDN